MRRIFGTKKEVAPPPTIDEANGKLTTRGDVLDDKIRKLDEQLMKHKEVIKRARGPAAEAAKRRALQVLKQKRMLETQREQLYNQQMNMEQTSFAVQNMQDNIAQVRAMKAANKDLKGAFKSKELNIDSIEKMNDEMADMMDMHNDIQEALGQNYALPEDVDEEDLMGELDALEDELSSEPTNAASVPSYLQEPDLPSAPMGRPHASHQHEPEDDFGLPAVPQRT